MNKLRRILLTLLVLSVTFLYGCGGENSEAAPETDTTADPTEEEAAPVYIAFEGTDLEGNKVSQEVFTQSKLTMVNVWATFCNPCLNEMPGLGELAAESPSAGQRHAGPGAVGQCERRAHHLLF